MMFRFFLILKKIIVDLIRVYLFILLYPLKIFFFYLVPNNRIYKILSSLIMRLIVLPMTRLITSLLIFLIIRPMRYIQYHLIFPYLMNSSDFLNELQPKRSYWLTNPKYLYKYILYNKNIKHFKFLNPLSEVDGITDHFIKRLRIIFPNWRYENLAYYHTNNLTYERDMYKNALYIVLNDAIQVKQLESFKYTMKNFILLYRYIYANIKYDCLSYIYRIRYKLLYKLVMYLPNTTTIENMVIKLINYMFYFLYHMIFIIKYVTFYIYGYTIRLFLNNKIIALFYDFSALMDVPNQRSIHYSKLFGFTGNLFLEYSDFLNVWNMNLTKETDLLQNRFQYMLDFPYDLWYSQNNNNNIYNRSGDWSFSLNNSKYQMQSNQFGLILGLFSSYYNRFEEVLENSNFAEEYTTHSWYLKTKHNKTKSNIKEELIIPSNRYDNENIERLYPGYNPDNDNLNPIEDIYTGIVHLSNVTNGIPPYSNRYYSKYKLSKHNKNTLVSTYILDEYYRRFKFYLKLHTFFGKVTYLVMIILNHLPFMFNRELNKRHRKGISSILHEYNLLSGPLISLIFIILILESFILIYYVNLYT